MSHPIEFQLFAPYNKAAALMGSFSNWEPMPMQKDQDGYFRISVELEDDVYQYKFHVQSRSWFFKPAQWVMVNDPYATDIDISNGNENSVVRVKDGQRITDTYVWQHDDKLLPADHELVIYELHIGDFSGDGGLDCGGKYEHVVEKLDYLCELGINAIALMPVNENPGNHGWGYNPRYLFATESNYGSTTDLKRLIDRCHGQGIRVILDGVYNHSEAASPLTQIDHDYWYHHSPRDSENSWGPEFNYEYYDETLETYPARRFIGDSVRFWIQEYHIDGLRYDAARQIANYDFMHWIVQQAKQTASMKPFYNIAEYIPETTDLVGPEGPMDGCWHESFYHCVLEHVCGDTFDLQRLEEVLDSKRQGYPHSTSVVNYITNHDHNRLMAELGEREVFGEAAFKRAKLAAALLISAIGVPLIWMGEEFGEYKDKTPNQNKIEWPLLGNQMNRGLFEYYKGLIALRKHNQALYTENINFFHEDPDSRVLAYVRWNNQGSQVVVIANFSDRDLAGYRVPNFPKQGTWHEWTGNYDIKSAEHSITVNLPAYEARVLVWQ